MKLYGFYYLRGYEISREDGSVLYSARNHYGDSQTMVAPDDENALPIDTLKWLCEQTGKEFAHKHGATWAGCTLISEDVDCPYHDLGITQGVCHCKP